MTATASRMNEHAREWVAALRSGEYPQQAWATGRLRDDDGFSPLGVAADLFAAGTGRADWLGLRFQDGGFHAPYRTRVLGFPGPHVRIASIIESEPPGLFA